jgi:quercetin dioxygenase-like cupin family protein
MTRKPMANTSLLSGRLQKWTLPVIQGRPGPDAPNLKRLALPQGELAQIHNSAEGMRYMAIIDLVPGTVRGNHFHNVKEEYIYVMRGELRILAEDPQTCERAELAVAAGELAFIAKGLAHVLQILAAGQAIEFSPAEFNPADSFPWQVSG